MKTVAVIGLGRLGLCRALCLERAGYEVFGVDNKQAIVDAIMARDLQTTEPGVREWLSAAKSLHPGTSIEEAVRQCDTVLLLVATPSQPDGRFSPVQLDAVEERLTAMGRCTSLKDLIIGSTTMPGYCDGLAARLAPLNYEVSYNPEFIAQGTILRDQLDPRFILIGASGPAATERVEQLNRAVVPKLPTVHRLTRLEAEIAKLALNCFLTLKISFANSIGDLATRAGADPQRILDVLKTDHRVGPALMQYGFGFGGPCLPRDNRAMGAFASTLGITMPIQPAVDQANSSHLAFQVAQTLQSHPRSVPVDIHGVAYKAGTTLLDESQPLAYAEALARAGLTVCIHERAEIVAELKQRFGNLFSYRVKP